jgi:RNA polymerase-binding transcription factor DksA
MSTTEYHLRNHKHSQSQAQFNVFIMSSTLVHSSQSMTNIQSQQQHLQTQQQKQQSIATKYKKLEKIGEGTYGSCCTVY